MQYFRQLTNYQNNLVLNEELFAKALQTSGTRRSVSNGLCGKIVLSLEIPIIFDDNVKVTLVSLFVPNFNFSSQELDNFDFALLN